MSAWPNRVMVGDFEADRDVVGDVRVVTNLTGWSDAAPTRVAFEDKAQQDGVWDAAGTLGARVVGVEGYVERDTPAGASETAAELTALHPRALVQLVVAHETAGSTSALVRVTGPAVLEWLGDTAFTYTLQVTAPDPLRYGLDVFAQTTLAGASGGAGLTYPLAYPLNYGLPPGVVEGAVRCENDGTATYWPRLRIDGPVPNPTIYCPETGDRIKYAGTVLAGQHLDIDCANRRVTLGDNATSMRHKVTASGSWLAIPPGGASLAWSADSSNPTATLSVWSYEGAWS